jgi:predicted metalloprotease with PDZ domain
MFFQQRPAHAAMLSRLVLVVPLLTSLLIDAAAPLAMAGSGPTLGIDVDARDLPRRLVHTRLQVPCQPGELKLWFPKWIPGTHEPCGPVQNVGGLYLETSDGKKLDWQRDEVDLWRISCQVPEGVHQITARLDTICNEPAVLAAGYLTYGNSSVGIINWSTCLLYPEGPSSDDTDVRLTLHLPPRWKFATSLRVETVKAGEAKFQAVSLTQLVDSPLIAGEHLRTIRLDTGPYPPAFLDLASESKSAIELSPSMIDIYSRVVREAGALFGACHYPEYHFLVTCSDELGYFGLEHLTSSINGVHTDDLQSDSGRRGWVANLLPHEYVHSWCGKFRRPAGMCSRDFHTPEKTRLLWVYEGLGEYLGELLQVRSGLIGPEQYRASLAATIDSLSHREGRRWRSLEDTAVASRFLRGGSPNWNELRREQDYYFEGMLVWLEADAIIRQQSGGKKSLNDFCRKFLGANSSTAKVVPYELPEILTILHELADFDWEAFLAKRVKQPHDALCLNVVSRLGYRVKYTTAPPAAGASRSRRGRAPLAALDSIGLGFDNDGQVVDVIPRMAGDQAGLAPGMKVIGINQKTFSRQSLDDALADSVKLKKIELLLTDSNQFRTVVLNYAGGPRYFALERDNSQPDLLAEIIKPLDGKER